MINIKKSSKSRIFLSIIAAFILFSMAATYAFAANVNEPVVSYLPASSKSDTKSDIEIDIPEDFVYFNQETKISDILEELNKIWEKCTINFDNEDILALMENRAIVNIHKEELEDIRSEFEEIKKKLDEINFYNFFTFTASSYEELYEVVKNHFDEQVKAGNITQEKANEKLKEFVELYENKTVNETHEDFYSKYNEFFDYNEFYEEQIKAELLTRERIEEILKSKIFAVTIDIEGNIIHN